MPALQSSLPRVLVIETERLRLRAHTEADLLAMIEMWADPEVTRYLGSVPQNSQEMWTRYLRYVGTGPRWATATGRWKKGDKPFRWRGGLCKLSPRHEAARGARP